MFRALAPAALLLATPAAAELPDPVRAMIEAAIATGDEAKVEAVIEVARATNPADGAAIDRLHTAFRDRQAQLAAAKEAREQAALRTAGFFDNWTGEVDLGANRATGNSDNLGATATLSLNKTGVDWEHAINALADYQRTDGATEREQFRLSYEPRLTLSDRTFAFGLARFESARFQGYSQRYSLSGGLGHRYLDRPDAGLRVQVGPAFRYVVFPDGPLTARGRQEKRLASLTEIDAFWRPVEGIRFSEEARAFLQEPNSTFQSTTAFTAEVLDGLSLRLSYLVEHNTDPVGDAVKTDTLSRATLVFGF